MPEKSHMSVTETRNIPAALKVPDGEVFLLQAHGKGVLLVEYSAQYLFYVHSTEQQ